MVPCLHLGNIYIKRKVRVWRDQKCVPLLGANTPITCAGCQTTPSQGSRYMPENGNLRKLGWTYCHGTEFAPRQYFLSKGGYGYGETRNIFPNSVQKPLSPVQAVKLSRLEGLGIRSRTETCTNWRGPIAMVPCLHHSNIYITRKIRVWRDKKCIPLVGVKIPITCAGRQTTPSQWSRYMAEYAKLRKLG